MEKMNKYEVLSLKNVQISDNFWSRYIQLVNDVVIPYQWDALNDRIPDAEPSHAIKNFKIAAGLEKGEFYGWVFQDSDLAKWLEAVGYSLEAKPNCELESLADGVIDIIEKAQQEDGYLNTYFTIKEPGKRWTNLHECHELYCAGHMIEAAVAYYHATGKNKLLDVVCRFADHIDTVFGPEPGKIQGYDGHQEIELALVKLYKATRNEKYLRLSKYFIDERGKQPSFFEKEWEKRNKVSHWTGIPSASPSGNLKYNQAHIPVREQSEAVGHAVRAVYMYTAAADIAALTNDEELLKACKRLWDNTVLKQMYITGGIGSTNHLEAFTFNYDLPNDTIYQETCASIGLIFFAQRMLGIEPKSYYADVMERALYNSVLSGMAQDGKSFFYVNPLEVWPEACEKNPAKAHVKPIRQKWYGCSCCPPNIARLIASLGQYIYTSNENTVFTHLYIGGEAVMELNERKVKLVQNTDYPWNGKVSIKINMEYENLFTLALRIPGWCNSAKISVNGETISCRENIQDGYALIERNWKDADFIELDLDMPVLLVRSHPNVRENTGKVAMQRGPLVYCLEEVDNGKNLSAIQITSEVNFKAEYDANLLGGIVAIKGEALRVDESAWGEELYKPQAMKLITTEIKAVPYCLWGNRKPGEMQVWTMQR